MANKEWCRHYNGLALYDKCRAGIAYDTVRDESTIPYRFPCINETSVICPLFEHYSQEEIEKTNKAVEKFLEDIRALDSGESNICPHCGKQITSMRQVRRCVYASCGCRLWQGTIPERWRNSAR